MQSFTLQHSCTPPTGHHVREHRAWTAAAEKRILVWLARKTPRAINSDHLTALGFLSSLGVAIAFALTPWWARAPFLVGPLLFLNWLGDSLDGTLARVRDQQRPRYGYYVDHLLDIVGMTALGAGLAVSGLMHPAIALGVCIGYLLLSAESFLATHALGVLRISFSVIGPTELRLILAAGAIRAAFSPWVSPLGLGPVRLFDLGGMIAIAGMAAALVASGLRNAASLYTAERLAQPQP